MNELSNIVTSLRKFANDYDNEKVRLLIKNKIYNHPHMFFYSLLVSDLLKGPYSDIFKETFIECEKKFPGSSKVLCKILS